MSNTNLSPLTTNSIVIGIDMHKYSHTAVAMNILGKELSKLEFDNEQLNNCISWLKDLGAKKDLVMGLENVHGYGVPLAHMLSSNGFNIRYVPPVLTEREKTDHIDAKRVGKVVLHKIEETLPASPIIAKKQQKLRLIDLHIQEEKA